MINKILERISGGWVFLIVVAVMYLISVLLDLNLAIAAFWGSINIFKKIVPVFLAVFFLMFISRIFLDSERISKIAGKNVGTKGWLIVVFGGILSVGPIYMWYPFLAELKEKGMKDSLIAAFLYNRAVKIPLLPMMIHYFGLSFTLVLTFHMILFSIVNGILVEKIIKSSPS